MPEEQREGHWATRPAAIAVWLLLIFVLSVLVRSWFYWPSAYETVATYGPDGYVLSGNDPDYHKRAIDYVVEFHQWRIYDDMLNYPLGSVNPNPPSYEMSSALIGMLASPFYGGDAQLSTWVVFEFVVAFWAALGIIPTYFVARDIFGRKAGVLAALILGFMPANVERTPLGFSDHDAFIVFFLMVAVFFLLRALRLVKNERYIQSWRHATSVASGLHAFLAVKDNRKALLASLLSGTAIAAVALAWKGTTYIYALIFIYYLIHVHINRLRNVDSTGIALCVLTTMGYSILLAFPFYYIPVFTGWFETPIYIFVATVVFTLFLVPTRDIPWIIAVPGTWLVLGVSIGVVAAFFPSIGGSLFALQSYFIKGKLYTTIAEAQPPDFSRMAYAYGVGVFFLALIGLIMAARRLPKERWRNDYIFMVLLSVVSIFLAMSAVRFMFNATPLFAIFGAWMTLETVTWLKFREMGRAYRALRGEGMGDRLRAIKGSVKVRHVTGALFIAFMVLGPNIFYGIDAGIPFETKKDYDRKISDLLPAQMRPEGYNPSDGNSWWFGAFGTAFPGDAWTDAMFWLRTQDANLAESERPAFIAWWDYGHWSTHMARHPAAADNFQNGVEWSGNFITAQNESQAMALMAVRIVQNELQTGNEKPLALLEKYIGKDKAATMKDILQDPAKYKPEIVRRSDLYGPKDKEINDDNARYIAAPWVLYSSLSRERLDGLVYELEGMTGHRFGYFAADARMFPYAARNTGIYYAPVKLSDQNINDFLQVKAVGNDGVEYDPDNIPRDRQSDRDFRITDYKLYYKERFYNSMFYRAYVGYWGGDVGQAGEEALNAGIPGIVGDLRQSIPMQGFNMSHFRLVYRTTFWNPYSGQELGNHSNDWKVVPPWVVAEKERTGNGTVDPLYRGLYSGVFMLRYYHGAYVNGTVKTSDGRPVGGATVTVYDDLNLTVPSIPGVPHDSTVTDAGGRYSLLAPFGGVTVRVANGGATTPQMLTRARLLGEAKFDVSENQAQRVMEDADGDSVWDFNIRKDFTVNTSSLNGTLYRDTDNSSTLDRTVDATFENGSADITLYNGTTGESYTATAGKDGFYSLENITPNDYAVYAGRNGHIVMVQENLALNPGENHTSDLAVKPGGVNGTVLSANGVPAGGVTLFLLDAAENRTVPGGRSLGGGPVAGLQRRSVTTPEGTREATVAASIRTDADGNFSFRELFPGNYTLVAEGGNLLGTSAPVAVLPAENTTINLSLSPSLHLTGTLRWPKGPAGGVLIYFQNRDGGISNTTTTNATGRFELDLAAGNTTLYAHHGPLVAAIKLFLFPPGGGMDIDVTMEPAVRVNGTTYSDANGNSTYDGPVDEAPPAPLPSGGPGVPLPTLTEAFSGINLTFESPAAYLSLQTNRYGYYLAFLPPGNYTVRAEKPSSGGGQAYGLLTALNLTSATVADLAVEVVGEVKGTVYYDEDGDAIPGPGEGLGNVTLAFRDEAGGFRADAASNSTGGYSTGLPPRKYTLDVRHPGFLPYSDTVAPDRGGLSKNIPLQPLNITVAGKASAAAALTAPVTLKFVPVSTGAREASAEATAPDGNYSASLVPGRYYITADSNITLGGIPTRLLLNATLNLSIGERFRPLDLALVPHIRVNGTLFEDANNNSLSDQGEERSVSVRFIGKGGEAAVDANNGTYEAYLEPGTYTVLAALGPENPPPGGIGPPPSGRLAHLGTLALAAPMSVDLPLAPAAMVRGAAYFDENGNGAADEPEHKGGLNITLSRAGDALTVRSDPAGTYTAVLPLGDYAVNINHTTNDTLTPSGETVWNRYTYSAGLTLSAGDRLAGEKEAKFNLSREVKVAGYLYFDTNWNGSYDPGEEVPAVGMALAGNTTYMPAPSTGRFELFIAPGAYNVTVAAGGYAAAPAKAGVTVAPTTTWLNISLEPLNLTLNGTLFIDASGNGVRDAGEDAAAGEVSFITDTPGDAKAANATATADAGGLFTVALRPGTYLMYAATPDRVYYGNITLAPLRTAAVPVPLGKGSTLQADLRYNNSDGQRLAVPGEQNITIVPEGRGTGRVVSAGAARISVLLPPGNFTLKGGFTASEYGQGMQYLLNEVKSVEVSGPTFTEVRFAKKKVFGVRAEWDYTQQRTISAGEKVNYTVTLTSTSNEPGTWDLRTIGLGDWNPAPEAGNITLKIGESRRVVVNMTSPPNARAGENIVTLNATSRNDTAGSGEVALRVNVLPFFGANLTVAAGKPPSAEGNATKYSLQLQNSGNGQDTFNITVAGAPPGWNVTLDNSAVVMGGGESRDITVTAVHPERGASRVGEETVYIKAVSTGSGGVKSSDVTLHLTFPDLRAASGALHFNGTDVVTHLPKPVPGFDGAVLLALMGLAVAGTAFAGRRGLRSIPPVLMVLLLVAVAAAPAVPAELIREEIPWADISSMKTLNGTPPSPDVSVSIVGKEQVESGGEETYAVGISGGPGGSWGYGAALTGNSPKDLADARLSAENGIANATVPTLLRNATALDSGTFNITLTAPKKEGNYILRVAGISAPANGSPAWNMAEKPLSVKHRRDITLNGTVRNAGAVEAKGVNVTFYVDGVPAGSTVLDSVPAKGTANASVVWKAAFASTGPHKVRMVIDPQDNITELSEKDNSATSTLYITTPPPPEVSWRFVALLAAAGAGGVAVYWYWRRKYW